MCATECSSSPGATTASCGRSRRLARPRRGRPPVRPRPDLRSRRRRRRRDGAGRVDAAARGRARGVRLFDVWSGTALYRVFLLPGCLQLDLSLAPQTSFGARAPSFRLLFGTAAELPAPSRRPPRSSWATPPITPCEPASSSAAGSGWPSTGRVPPATTRSRSRVAGATCRRAMAAASTSCRRRCWRRSRARFPGRSSRRAARALAAAIDGLLREAGELGTALEPQLRSISQPR